MNGPANMHPTTFAQFWALGYHRLCPIIPPGAPLSATSNMAKRAAIGKDPRGKAPGVIGYDGRTWHGFDFVAHESDELDCQRWQRMGAGIGIKTGRIPGTNLWLIGIDADTTDEALAEIIRDVIGARFGRLLPIRVGNYPKALYLILCEGEFRYSRIEFGPPDTRGIQERVELLSDGKQFVAYGTHPGTREPYAWPRPLLPLDDLPRTTPEALLALLDELRGLLPEAKPIVREGASADDVNQDALKGPIEAVRKAVAAIPNTSELFPTRESCIKLGYAIKGATQDDEATGLELFREWLDTWTDGDNAEGFAEAEWHRMKPPFKIGADYLFEQAQQHGAGKFDKAAEIYHEPIVEREPLFPQPPAQEAKKPLEPLVWIDPAYWDGVKPPEREWIVLGFVPRGEVTLLYGDGGIGKTLLAQLLATSMAAGLPFLGQETTPGKVMCFFCEDGEDEIHRRQHAINKALGVTGADMAGRLRISIRRVMDNLLAHWDRGTGAMARTPLWQQLVDEIRAFGADLVILDTLADIYAGNEIDRAQVTAFVKACLGRLGAETGATVMVLGHPSQSGQQSGRGTSGSTAWSNAVRSRLYLRYPKGQERGNFRELEGMKANYSAKGALLKLKWVAGSFEIVSSNTAPRAQKIDENAFGNVPGSIPASTLAALARGEGGSLGGSDVAVVTGGASPGVANSEDVVDAAIVAFVRLHAGEGMAMGSATARNYAPRVLKRVEPVMFEGFGLEELAAGFDRLLGAGRLEPCEARNAQRHVVKTMREGRECGTSDGLSDDTQARAASDKASDSRTENGGIFG